VSTVFLFNADTAVAIFDFIWRWYEVALAFAPQSTATSSNSKKALSWCPTS